jgi:hypothetical protein
MRRFILAATSVAILLLALVPAALAADPVTPVPGAGSSAIQATGEVALTVDGALDVPSGTHVRAAIVVDGTAAIAGSADTLLVVGGTAKLTGATVDRLVVVDGRVDLGPGTSVGDVATLGGTVTRDATATIAGRTTSLEADLAAIGIILVPLALLFTAGLAAAALVAGLLVAAFGARQVRELEDRITRQPGHVLLAGVVGTIALPVVSGLLVATVVGAPVGLFLLIVGIPVLAFIGWLVAAVWVGDWLLVRAGGTREAGHPYRAALLGVVVLAVASVLPLVSAVAGVFGLGAILLGGWDAVRPERPSAPVADPMPGYQVAPSAG